MGALAVLNRWEALPLDDSIYPFLEKLDAQCKQFPVPAKFATSSSATGGNNVAPSSNEDAVGSAQTAFLHWYEGLAQQMEREQEAPYLAHLAQVNELKEKASSMMQVVSESLTLLDEISEEHAFVQEKSVDLQSHCDDLLQEQVRHSSFDQM